METLSLIAIPERSAFAERDKTFICIGYSSHKCIATLNGFAPLNQAVKAPCLYSLATGLYGFIAIFMATVLCLPSRHIYGYRAIIAYGRQYTKPQDLFSVAL